jgi:mRNA interferase RelE/StbE
MRQIAYSRSAIKVLRKTPVNTAKRITSKIEQYVGDPKSLANNVTALTGSAYIRLRIAGWRVIMDDRNNVLEILKIGPRGGVYD